MIAPTTLFALHYLGGSAREWTHVATHLGERYRVVAIDLPGFGDAAQTPGYRVREMAEHVARAIAADAPQRWMIVGHSMGAKVATTIARSFEDGTLGLDGLVGLVLLAGSPPGPEPIPDADRAKMLGWFSGDPAASTVEARQFVATNSGAHLDPAANALAVADALRGNPDAWRAWLQSGSREDLAGSIGVLQTPTLLIAGGEDPNLGKEAQRRLVAPHFARVRCVTIPGAKHLLPLEVPADVARLIDEHATDVSRRDAYDALIASNRVGAATRAALVERAKADDAGYAPVAMDARAFATLRAVLARVVPQIGPEQIDLAARIDRELADGVGDGWRFATLPPDARAYGIGLATLDATAERECGRAFRALDDARADAILRRVAEGAPAAEDPSEPHHFDAAQMRAWFEDLRAEAVKLYMAHPATLAAIGYSGIANGGDGSPKSGFVRVGLGEREAWEPLARTGPSA